VREDRSMGPGLRRDDGKSKGIAPKGRSYKKAGRARWPEICRIRVSPASIGARYASPSRRSGGQHGGVD